MDETKNMGITMEKSRKRAWKKGEKNRKQPTETHGKNRGTIPRRKNDDFRSKTGEVSSWDFLSLIHVR